jgi:hypothetical protein
MPIQCDIGKRRLRLAAPRVGGRDIALSLVRAFVHIQQKGRRMNGTAPYLVQGPEADPFEEQA